MIRVIVEMENVCYQNELTRQPTEAAGTDELKRATVSTSREGFKMAMDISAFSLLAVCDAAKDIMSSRSSIACMTYFGGEKCAPGYNVMGVCKAALEAATRYAAFDLGPQGIRVNALSAGPVVTLAGSAANVRDMLAMYSEIAPMNRNVSVEEVGRTGAFLLSDMSDGMTGEIMHVDCGYNMMGSPGRLMNVPGVKEALAAKAETDKAARKSADG